MAEFYIADTTCSGTSIAQRMMGRHGYTKVDGEPITFRKYPRLKAFGYIRIDGVYVISEATTGTYISEGPNKKAAMAHFHRRMKSGHQTEWNLCRGCLLAAVLYGLVPHTDADMVAADLESWLRKMIKKEMGKGEKST